MKTNIRNLSVGETWLLLAMLALLLVAWLAPPVAQPAHYHDFADQRSWFGLPCAMDVLSNLPFALFGWLGLQRLRRLPAGALDAVQTAMAGLFFWGLIATAACSSIYHWHPDDGGLAIDRIGMTLAFAGLLGLGVAGRISARAAMALAWAVLLLGTASVVYWHANGNVLPWSVVQGGGMVLLLALAAIRPLPGALAVRWWQPITIYVVAKLFELGDYAVFGLSGELISGHSLKHLVAALAAAPVLTALGALRQNASDPIDFAETRQAL